MSVLKIDFYILIFKLKQVQNTMENDQSVIYWVDAKVSADFLKNVFKRCSTAMDAWFSCT